MDNNIFKKFGENLKKVLVLAEKNARERNAIVDTEHQLGAITLFKDCLANEILSDSGVTSDRVALITSLLTKRAISESKISADAKKAIQLSVQIAADLGHFSIEPEHLLLALVSDRSFNSYLVIERIGVDPKILKNKLESIFTNLKKKIEDVQNPPVEIEMGQGDNMGADSFDFMGSVNPGMPLGRSATATKGNSFLDLFTTNLSKMAREKTLDPVIGREKEIQRITHILSRRTKNNPVLIGEPGVGKTSIVEGLANRIIDGNVPEKLANTEILSIDIGSILAGTMYRGQFESRIKKILAEIKKKGNVILFADEIHMLVGAGSTEGSVDAANLLKPMLARGELRMIGSTTFDEYKKHIEKDPAFERRFQPIQVEEPTVAETINILSGIKERYEKFHNVVYEKEALESAAVLSKRYINDRFLPDKAIDLIDEAGAATSEINPSSSKLATLRKKLQSVLKIKDELIEKEKYEEAAKLRQQEIRLENNIHALNSLKNVSAKVVITTDNIARIVSNWTGIPVTALNASEKKRYLAIEKTLRKYIIGQNEAVKEVAKALKRHRVGISNPNKPIGSFLFLGPTGVGKTELARVLAKEFYGNENALVKIDMSEFMERHNLSRLVGAPAGYVGYEEGGKLTEVVRKNPYSIILLDEIEKAHPETFNILLQIMDEGILSDAKGRKIDFKNTILVMTSNLGTEMIRHQSSIGFVNSKDQEQQYSRLKESIEESVEKNFRPEFINRLDKTVIFYQLTEKDLRKIVDLQLEELNSRLLASHFKLVISDEIKDLIAKESYSPLFGARPIKKYIADHIEFAISEAILAEKFHENDTIELKLKNGKILVS